MNGLEIQGLSVNRGGRPVLFELAFAVPAGTWSGLIGVNGAGKTTLLRAIAGRLPAEAGEVRVDGAVVADPRERARLIGLSTAPERLPGGLIAARLVEEIARAHGAEPRPARLEDLHAALALDEILARPIDILSAGQRQRLGLFLAFLGAPRLVLLDEPFNALDPLIAFDLKRALKALAADGLTIVTALHDLPTVALHCGHGLLLSHGRLAEIFEAGTLQQAQARPAVFEAEVLERWRRAERTSGRG